MCSILGERKLIENAIEIVSHVSARNGHKSELWSARQPKTQRECEIDTVTKLADFERFAFVLSVLERHTSSRRPGLFPSEWTSRTPASPRSLKRWARRVSA